MVKCGKCGHENPQGMKFCSQCGTPLDIAPAPAAQSQKGRGELNWQSVHARIIDISTRFIPRIPFYKVLAPYLELDRLAYLNPWIVLGSLGLSVLLGLYPSYFGHIDTKPGIYQIMPIISCINPALGLLSGIVFGISDMAQKMVTNNIYGSTGAGNYIGARIGYIIAYSAVIVAGVLPGVLARAFRNAARQAMAGRATSTADGGQLAGSGLFNMATIAAILGGAIGAMASNVAAIGLEFPAFYLRPNPDTSCYSYAIGNLTGGIPLSGIAGGVGGAGTAISPGLRGGGGPEVSPPGTDWGTGTDFGGPGDNPLTNYDGGNGPGQCGPQGLPNYWINTATLNLVVQDLIFAYQGLGPKVALRLTYNTGRDRRGMFGRNWAFSHESSIDGAADKIVLRKGSGQRLYYRPGSPAGQAAPGAPIEAIPTGRRSDRLFDYGQYWLLTEKDTHLAYRFDRSPVSSVSRLTSISDPSGNVVRISYNDDGTIASIADAAGRQTRFSYDDRKRCTAITVPNGRTARCAYDDGDNLIRVVDLQGISSGFEYDADYYLIRMEVGGKRRITEFNYRGSGREKHLSGVTDAKGNTTRYEMASVSPRLVRAIDPAGKTTSYESTEDGLASKVTGPMGDTVLYGYDGGLRVSAQSENGQITRMEYDARGNLSRIIDPLGYPYIFTYDPYDYLTSFTSPLGNTIRYTYDERHRLTRLTSPMGEPTMFNYDARGQLIAMTDPKDNTNSYTYDKFGNLVMLTGPRGDTVKISYDEYGIAITGITDARGNLTRYRFDGNNRLTLVTHPDGATLTQIYDCCAGITTIDENANKTEFILGPLLDIEQIVDPMGSRTRYDYDGKGRLVGIIDSLDRHWALTYNDAGRVIQVTNPSGDKVRMSYDSAGNLLSLEDGRGKRSLFAYDTYNLVARLTDPLGQARSITWGPTGLPATMVNARGGTLAFAYDADGRIRSESHDGVRAADFKYDDAGNLTTVIDATGVTAYTYDADNRVTSIRYPDGLSLSVSYDAAGNIRTIAYPGGLAVSYDYDVRNRIVKAAWGKDSIAFRYDAAGYLIGESRSNGAESAYGFDAAHQFTEIAHRTGNDEFIHIRYTTDAVGNTTRISAVQPLLPDIDAMAVVATYNDANQVVTRGPEAYTYDADGNLTGISGDRWHAVYDPLNRPIEIRRDGQTAAYAYDGIGRRRRSVKGTSIRNYYHDAAGRLLFETDGSGQIIAWYVYRGTSLVARINPMRESHFYHFDGTGSTLALSGADGKVSAAYAYRPFGLVGNRSGHDDGNPFTYVGEHGVMDEGGGLFFMKNRYYDANTGRFLQKDPLGLYGGTNSYAYVGNNPVIGIDPEGLLGPLIAALVVVTLMVVGGCNAGSSQQNINFINGTLKAINNQSYRADGGLNKINLPPQPPKSAVYTDPLKIGTAMATTVAPNIPVAITGNNLRVAQAIGSAEAIEKAEKAHEIAEAVHNLTHLIEGAKTAEEAMEKVSEALENMMAGKNENGKCMAPRSSGHK